MFRVLVLDDISGEGIGVLTSSDDITVVENKALGEAELIARLPGFDGLLVRSATQVSAAAIAAAVPTLRVIGRAGVGVDNIDLAAASAHGVAVFNSPAGNVNAAAEHTIALMLALARNVSRGDAGLRAGRWDRKGLTGSELAGKSLGLVGFGRVGRIVARVATALGMSVSAFDPPLAPEVFAAAGVARAIDLDSLIAASDWVSLHLPSTPETRGLFGRERLARMKRGARLVNAARGSLVDLEALQAALESGHLAGAALDVFPTEPCTDSPLFRRADVVATPHLGASTHEAQVQVAIDASTSVLRCLKEGRIEGAVNRSALTP